MDRGLGFERQSMSRSDPYPRLQKCEPLRGQSETRRTISAKDLGDEAALLSWAIINGYVAPFNCGDVLSISGGITTCAVAKDREEGLGRRLVCVVA
jgi:hypothetical protein